MTKFYSSMIDDSNDRFYYLCRCHHYSHEDEIQFERFHGNVPIRDLASAWDAGKAVRFLLRPEQQQSQQQQQSPHDPDAFHNDDFDNKIHYTSDNDDYQSILKLVDAIHTTLSSYQTSSKPMNIDNDECCCCCIDPSSLVNEEIPTIGHSAMWILAMTELWRIDEELIPKQRSNNVNVNNKNDFESIAATRISLPTVQYLVHGILQQQCLERGGFRIQFGDEYSVDAMGDNDIVDANNNNNNDHIRNDNNDDDMYCQGIEFFPGEAMVALLEVYELSTSSSQTSSSSFANDDDRNLVDERTCQSILLAMESAFGFYSRYYYDHKDKQQTLDTNYNIWQIQAFVRFFVILKKNKNNDKEKTATTTTLSNDDTNIYTKTNMDTDTDTNLLRSILEYVIELCYGIITSPSWRELNRGKSFYPNLNTLEIVCGLDALADVIHVLETNENSNNNNNDDDDDEQFLLSSLQSSEDMDEMKNLFRLHVRNGVDFLMWAQGNSINGGLGFGGIHVTEQRLDVTGHAISALTKLI